MELTEQQRAACAAMEDTWYWQVQERGKWRYRWHNEVMVRYYECAPLEADIFPAMIEYLQGQTGITSIQLHGKRIELDGEWKAVRAWYETRDGDTSETNKLKRVRICQALEKNSGENGGEGPYVVENGCRYKVEHTFHWNADTLPELPASSSGVNYQIQAVTRDDETGLWNCVVEKRERVQQDIAEYTTEKTVFETKKEELHLGVKQGSVASTGKSASVSGGKMVTRKLQKNEDCTTDIINETTEEEAVSGAVTETEVNLRGTVTTTVNRSQPGKADETGLGIGTTVRNEKTPGGRWTQTIKKVVAAAAGVIRSACRKTVFRHTDVETRNQKNDPGISHVAVAAGGVMHEIDVQRRDEGTYDVTETTHTDVGAPEAVTETRKFLDGTVTRTVNRNQPNKASEANLGVGDTVRNEKTESGLWDQTIEKARPVATGRTGETCEETALVHAHSTTEGVGREKPEGEAPQALQGETTARRIAKTERGAWTVTDETRTAKTARRNLGTAGSEGRTVETEVLRNQTEIGTAPGGINVETEVSGSINEFGLVDGTVRRVQHVEARKSATGGSKGRTIEVESAINSQEPPNSAENGINAEVDVSVSPNEHGTASWTKRKVTYKKETATANASNPVVSSKETVTINDEETNPQDTANDGEVVDISVSPNEHGSATVRKVRRTAKPKMETKEWETDDGNYRYHHYLVVFRNQESVPDVPDSAYSMSVSVSINEYGRLDGVISGVTSREGSQKTGIHGDSQSDNTKKVTAYATFRRANGKYYRQKFTATCRYLRSTIDNMWSEAAGGESEPLVGWISGIKGSYAVIYSNIMKSGNPEELMG